jgi:flagellar biosynthesis/type III secretory pathway M-ring protein FliF/YscJ
MNSNGKHAAATHPLIATIKWHFSTVTLLLLIVMVMLILFFKGMKQAVKNLESRAEARIFQYQPGAQLDEGKDSEHRKLAEERLNTCIGDAWAH